MTTFASYFSLNTGVAERDTETTVATIRFNFFLIFNLKGVGFVDASEKLIVVPDPDKRLRILLISLSTL